MKKVMIGLLVVVVLSAGGYWGYLEYLAPQNEETDTAVSVTDITTSRAEDETISAEGRIVPLRDVLLAFEISGPVSELLVKSGDIVQMGDPLIRLDATQLENKRRQAEIGLAQAEAALLVAEQQLLLAQAAVDEAGVGVTAAAAQRDLIIAEPSAEQIGLAENGIAQADAGLLQAQANQSLVVQGANASQIRTAEAQLNAAIAQRRPIRDAYDQILRLEITGEAEEQARSQLVAAEASVIAAQAALDTLNSGATFAQRQAAADGVAFAEQQQAIAQAQLDLLQAGAKLEAVAVAELGIDQATQGMIGAATAVTQAEAAVVVAETAVVQAEVALFAAETALTRATINAPFTGTVADLFVETGEIVQMGLPVLMLADFSEWQVETTDLTELDVVDLAVGQEVEIQVDALPNQALMGVVEAVGTIAGETRGDVTYAVTVSLTDEAMDLPLRWGMTVLVEVDA